MGVHDHLRPVDGTDRCARYHRGARADNRRHRGKQRHPHRRGPVRSTSATPPQSSIIWRPRPLGLQHRIPVRPSYIRWSTAVQATSRVDLTRTRHDVAEGKSLVSRHPQIPCWHPPSSRSCGWMPTSPRTTASVHTMAHSSDGSIAADESAIPDTTPHSRLGGPHPFDQRGAGRTSPPAAQHGCVERAVSTEYLYRRPASMYVRK